MLIDQTRLPGRTVYLNIRSAGDAVRAIQRLAVRGAPNIGVAAAYALVVEAARRPDQRLLARLRRSAVRLAAARPTAVNLRWAVERVMARCSGRTLGPEEVRRAVEAEARAIEREEVERSRAIARHGLGLIGAGATVLTVCNTGPLAGPGLGTALGIVLHAHARGRRVRAFACETRPLLQGARLTMLELGRAGVPATLITDSAAASVMPGCDLVLAGADRVARNGDTANKVGTRTLAILARFYRRPFYVAAPSSTFDWGVATGRQIPVEQRGPEEVTSFGGCRVAPAGSRAFNPSFDITSARLITGFVTEQGILRPPFGPAIARLVRRK